MDEFETVTLYLETEGEAGAALAQLRAAASEDADLDVVAVEVEDVERSTVEVVQSITVTLTAVGGAVGGANLLLGRVTKLVKNVKGLRAAWRETDQGPVPIEVAVEPTVD